MVYLIMRMIATSYIILCIILTILRYNYITDYIILIIKYNLQIYIELIPIINNVLYSLYNNRCNIEPKPYST